MIVQCPHCPAKLNVPYPRPDDLPPVRCPRCQAVFQPPEEQATAPDNESDDPFGSVASEPTQPTNRKPAQPAAKQVPVKLIVGALVGIGAIVGLVFAVAGGSGKPKETASNTPEPVVTPKKESPPKKENPRPNPTPPKLTIPVEYTELFAATVTNRPAPTVLVPALQNVSREQLTIPPFAAKVEMPEDMGKMTLDETKKATAFLKVAAGALQGSGSGFVIRADGEQLLVATNHHVISPRSATVADGPPVVTVVFESGSADEWERPGEVIAADSELDLAIVRVTKAKRTPKPIIPALSPKLMETMDIRICGFPFGGALALGARNPNITIGKGTVSSIQLNEDKKIGRVQIDGSMNPGNSGGPVVDAEGRLVGVAVSIIKGSNGIGFAVPAHELATLLAGRVYPALVLPVGSDERQASFKLLAPLVDPLGNVKGATLHIWTGDKAPEPEPDPAGGWKPIDSTTKVELAKTDLGTRSRALIGDFRLPAGIAGKTPTVVLQLECKSEAGAVLYSKPVVHKFVLNGVQSASDAIPMDTFRKSIAKYADQVVAVRGRMIPGTPRRGLVYELLISDDADVRPEGLTFVADREVATQLNELAPEDQSLPVRLTLKVGKPATDGTTAVRVTQVDFIAKGNRISNTIPSTETTNDPLILLNRAPEKFVGQTIPVIGYLSPVVAGREDDPELTILLVSEQRPGNLHFATTPVIAAKVRDPALRGFLHVARFTLRVENKELDGVGPRIVTVTKIELIDRTGKLVRVIE
ncbi:MAG: trypsin-like peptidase domain-containing protein [Planctomycetes bacterium]|nr:trypsin-like peptidase domain-containing protein [Planctomycetota bacterium]